MIPVQINIGIIGSLGISEVQERRGLWASRLVPKYQASRILCFTSLARLIPICLFVWIDSYRQCTDTQLALLLDCKGNTTLKINNIILSILSIYRSHRKGNSSLIGKIGCSVVPCFSCIYV